MSLALTAAQIALAVVMLTAANGKLLRSDEFIAALRLSRLPEAAVRVAAVGTPVLEVALAFWLVLAPAASLPVAFATTAAVLVIFTGWMTSVRARRLYVRCGCFG